ncbi:molybdopterin-dependent oxidoreductase [Bradymonas sediminis]|uniref:Nitrate reductase n=1 Tax=Bradymonas sediminis TaxID=1548548 RepID=A0A2Z4FLY6_9DELT|nr:molybdopterin-dependent oxidoreductase [Bradymonas sediminis]AWV89971.1 nitrate reductase [Bradymonas sediminis]TDP76075.1 periplasmic nitrate reductase subunit NapA apoprotein [Bradymonas sediminis]
MDRRKFLKIAALTTATAAANKLAYAQESAGKAPQGDDATTMMSDSVVWNKAPCRFCGTGCHLQVGVDKKKGKVVAIAGDRKAEVNKGLACVKGYHAGLLLYGSDRLTTPMLKKGDKHVPISWDEALSIVAKRVLKDPSGFAFYGSGQWTIPEGYAAQKFMKGGLACNHIDPNARLCMSSAVTGFESTYGVDEPAGTFTDLDKADVIICWGNNPAEMHPVLFSRIIDRRSRGEKVELIDLGTRRTRTTDHADHYMEFNPQTDLAIANCISQQLIANGTYDREFVEKYCNFRKDNDLSNPTLKGDATTFEDYKKLVAEYTPEMVSELSGLSVAQLQHLGKIFGDPKKKITSLWCMGMNQHTRGTDINRLVHGIHLLSGKFGSPGNAPTSLTGQPSACGTAREVGTLAHLLPGGRLVAKPEHRKDAEEYWNLPAGRINPTPGYHTVKMWEKFSTPSDKGGDIHTIWVQVTNPGQSLPNLEKLFYPSRKLDDKFLIVSDGYPTESTRHADLILPSAMWVEKNGMVGNSERRTQQWFRMVEPPKGARDDAWQTIAVARKLYDLGFEGMKDKDGKFIFAMQDEKGKEVPVWKWENYYDINVDKQLFEEYRLFSRMKHKNLAPYDEYVKARGLRWPVVEQKDGTWRETQFRFAAFDDPFVEKGKKIDFYHSTTNDGRAQIWFAPYTAPPEMPDKEYPLWLCTGRVLEHWHSGTMTMRIPQLRRAMPQAYVEINPSDAREMGIANGEKVRLVTRRGQLDLPAWINGRGKPPKGSVFVPWFDERLLINLITLDAHCPISKQPDYKKCAVKITKIAE